jgi:hypothetical protein
LIAEGKRGKIICTAQAEGSTHDFKLYGNSIGAAVSGKTRVRGDSGHQGILRLHKNSEGPKKKPRGGKLTVAEKADNQRISRWRILIENINAKIKVFKIFSNKYRNRRRRFGLRMSLICGIVNFELDC